jgi:hypothetical protein
VIIAVVILGVVDHFRGGAKSDACGQAKTIMKRHKVKGQWRTLCPDCGVR